MPHLSTEIQNLVSTLENYLLTEGLLLGMPEPVRRRQFRGERWRLYWVILLCLSGVLTVTSFLPLLSTRTLTMLLVSCAAPYVLFHLIDEFQYHYSSMLLTRKWRGRLWLLGSSLFVVLISAVLTGEAIAAGISSLFTVFAYFLMKFLVNNFERTFSIRRELRRSVAALPGILPVVVILIVISVFAQELWLSVGTLSGLRLLIVVAIILGLAFLMVISRWHSLAQSFPSPLERDYREITHGVLQSFVKGYKGALFESIQEELGWRDLQLCRDATLKAVIQAWRVRMLVRLISTAVLLGTGLSAALFLLFNIVFTNESLGFLLEENLENRNLVIARVVFFVVAILLVEFLASLLRDHELQELVFGDLRHEVQKWSDVLVLYNSLVERGYVSIHSQFHEEIGLLEKSIVVPCETTENELFDIAGTISRNVLKRDWIAVTAFTCEHDAVYDVWAASSWYHFFIRNGVIIHTKALKQDPADISRQHEYGEGLSVSGQVLSDDWFGDGLKSRLGKLIWEQKREELQILHPYAYDCGVHGLWILIRLRYGYVDPLLAEKTAIQLATFLDASPESDFLPELVTISIYERASVHRVGYLLWYRGGKSNMLWVSDERSTQGVHANGN